MKVEKQKTRDFDSWATEMLKKYTRRTSNLERRAQTPKVDENTAKNRFLLKPNVARKAKDEIFSWRTRNFHLLPSASYRLSKFHICTTPIGGVSCPNPCEHTANRVLAFTEPCPSMNRSEAPCWLDRFCEQSSLKEDRFFRATRRVRTR